MISDFFVHLNHLDLKMHMAVKPTVLQAVWIGDPKLCNQIIDFFIKETGAAVLRPPETQYTGQEVVFVDHKVFINEGKFNLETLHRLVNVPNIKILVILFDSSELVNKEIVGILEKEGFSIKKIEEANAGGYALGAVEVYKRMHGTVKQFAFNPMVPPAPKPGELVPVKKFAEGFVLVTDVTNMPELISSVYDTKVYNYEPKEGWDSYNNQPLILVNKFGKPEDEPKVQKVDPKNPDVKPRKILKSDIFSVDRNPPVGNTDKTTVVVISDEKVTVPVGVKAYKFKFKNGDSEEYAKFFAELGSRIQRPDYITKRVKKKKDKPSERDDKGPRAFRKKRDEK